MIDAVKTTEGACCLKGSSGEWTSFPSFLAPKLATQSELSPHLNGSKYFIRVWPGGRRYLVLSRGCSIYLPNDIPGSSTHPGLSPRGYAFFFLFLFVVLNVLIMHVKGYLWDVV